MKPLRLVQFVPALVAVLLLVSCKQGPIEYDIFEQRTIEANLSAIDSASLIYSAQFTAGNIDAACAQAQAFLLTQEGVDTVVITPDSTVWAFFASGLLAGTGDDSRSTTDSGRAAPENAPTVRIARGGETGSPLHGALPFNVELPGTQWAWNAIRDCAVSRLGWGEEEVFTGSEVTVGIAEDLITGGSGVLFWSGHGILLPREPGPGQEPGIEMGRPYDLKGTAQAVASVFAGYSNGHAGGPRQIAVFGRIRTGKYHLVVLPEFIRVHGNLDVDEPLPQNTTKTIVYLSCCYSAYSEDSAGPGPLVQAFLDVGADLVCGYSWAVGDGFSCDKDTTFFRAMADTCMAGEAKSALGDLVDPNSYLNGVHAEFRMCGDTCVLLQAVLDAKKGGVQYRACQGAAAAMYGSEATKVYDCVRQDGTSGEEAMLTVFFPSTEPGSFDLSLGGAYISWLDMTNERSYRAQAGFVGTSGALDINRCTDSLVAGHFSAKLGWWDEGRNPSADPPDDTLSLEDGVLKFSGKIKHYGALNPQRLAAELPPSPR